MFAALFADTLPKSGSPEGCVNRRLFVVVMSKLKRLHAAVQPSHGKVLSAHSEQGVVLLETSLAMTFLVFVFMSIFTIANMLLPYLKLTQVADEALRTLSAIPRLEAGEFESLFADDSVFKSSPTDMVLETCRTNPSSNTRCGHLLAKRRVQFLFRTLDISFIDTALVEITTRRDEASGTVYVRIQGPHKGLFMNMFAGLPITVEAEGSYLFEQETP